MTLLQCHRPFEILLAEDNPGDVRLAREAFREANISHNLHVVADGVEAMAFLHHEGRYASAPTPDIILLDLNMPRMDGRRVLALVKGDPTLRRTPIVVLSSSENGTDIQTSYELQANCYITKPTDFDQYIAVVRKIEEFWAFVAELPIHRPAPSTPTENAA
jgi:CheY-like chemotaxis protein